jgi:hypothetical protein
MHNAQLLASKLRNHLETRGLRGEPAGAETEQIGMTLKRMLKRDRFVRPVAATGAPTASAIRRGEPSEAAGFPDARTLRVGVALPCSRD